MTDKNKPYFVTSKNFHGDNDYIEWLKEIKNRYQNIRNRVALQANYGALEFNWLLGRDIVQKKAESRWGSGVVNQLCLDLKAAFPDVRGFSGRNLYYMKEWYEFYMTDDEHKQILHQLGAEIVSEDKLSDILGSNGMLPIFGIVPWKHHLAITSKCKSIKEAFYYIARIIDEGLSKRELEDIIDADDFGKYGHAITNFSTHLPAQQSQLAMNVLKDPYIIAKTKCAKSENETSKTSLFSLCNSPQFTAILSNV